MENIQKDKPCPVCEEGSLHKDIRDVEIVRRGEKETVRHISGWFCDSCKEIEFDESTDSGDRFAAAGDRLVLLARVKAEESARRLKKARLSLDLTQADANLLAGGGHNAFSRYESGNVRPVAAVVHLFTLLERHPELLDEVRELAIEEQRQSANEMQHA